MLCWLWLPLDAEARPVLLLFDESRASHLVLLPPTLPRCVQGIMNEVELLKALNHRNIVK